MTVREAQGGAGCEQAGTHRGAATTAHAARLLQQMIEQRQAGRSLPGRAYVDERLYQLDLEHVFFRHWLFAGHSCDIPRPGDYFVFDIAGESLIILRDDDGKIRACANVCRHRGSKLCTDESGHARRIVCPYHQWSYRLDGTLAAARSMGDQFDPAAYTLRRVAVRDVAGLLFVCLADAPPQFEDACSTIIPQIRLNALERARTACRFDYTIRANWKIIVENNRECYHCQAGHPEFCRSNYDVGLNGDRRSHPEYEQALARGRAEWTRMGLAPRDASFPNGAPYRVARFPLKDGFLTESLDGQRVAPLMGDIPAAATGSLRIVTLPNAWIHFNCDYVVTTRLIPCRPESSRARVTFLVDGNARPGIDFDPDNVAAVWRATSEQDWRLCEQTQAGVRSRFYEPGPLSTLAENSVAAFLDWYLAQLLQADRPDVATRIALTAEQRP